MVKKLLIICGISLSFIQLGFASTDVDALNLSGKWICSGYDMHAGAYSDAEMTLSLDAKNSDFANNYGAYHFYWSSANGANYIGEVAASGNTAAVYFENTSQQMATDQGVGIATITHDRDANNKVTTVLHKFYYEPSYEGGGNGSETCVKNT